MDTPTRGIYARTPIRLTPSVVRRFWSKVARASGEECWLWIGGCRGNGYGCMNLGGKIISAHRIAFVIEHGREPGDGLIVMHRCDNRPCVRGDHLLEGAPKDNARDMVAKGRASPRRGEHHCFAKLTDAAVLMAWELRSSGVSNRKIAARIGVASSTVDGIFRGTRWAHVRPAIGF